MTHSDFVHLHVHTQYSLLDGACLIEKLVDKAVELKLPALAITDHGNLYGAIKFYQTCLKKGIKPIIGCEVYVAPQSRLQKEYKPGENTNNHLVLLAKDDQGYHNLIRLVSMAHLEGFYYKPRIDKEILAQYSNGLIGSSACLKGEISSWFLQGKATQAYKAAEEFINIFGKDNFYLELMENGLEDQTKVNQQMIELSSQMQIPLIATNDVHYLEKEHSFAHEALLCIQTQTTISDNTRFKFNSDALYMRSPAQMKELFKHVPQAISNTIEVADKCNLSMDFSKIYLPKFPLPEKETEKGYLRKLCYDNLNRRYPDPGKEIIDRLDYELAVIEKTGFASYFLIVWDLIRFARENNIPVGPGRGSAAGSIVSYLLKITDIDPLKYGLLFERFLNPARISMPDIDMDFCYEKRQLMLDYVAKAYGRENVAQIITFGSMFARGVVRDVGRVLDFSYSDVDKIAKMIPQSIGGSLSLEEALKTSPELAQVYQDEKIKKLIDVAIQLEGLSRHASTHAAGVVISDKPLIERVPLTKVGEGEMVTGFDMESLEKTGLLKMDFLGLKTLTVIEAAIKIIKRTKNISCDIDAIELTDPKTFELLAKGDTIGVFQLESRGMREILQKLLPTRFEDLIAVLALYRPGPLGSGMVEDFIERKAGRKQVTYLDSRLEPILKETYGIILYQEQTMQIVSALAGFDMAQADLLRKAIGKKIPEIMEQQRQKFVDGCKKNKISEAVAAKIFDLIEFFSGYGFNKSHSAAYALITYRTAYLKANFPVEFMAALLTSERTNTDKVVEYVRESERMGIKVLPPDINTSYTNFTVTDDGNIRFGLLAIKNVGEAALGSIIESRKQKKFENIFDFCDRIDSRVVNKKVLESLIKVGALDSFGLRRSQMLALMEKLHNKPAKKEDLNQMLFFSAEKKEETVPDVPEWSLTEILEFEKTLLGIYLTGHPLQAYSYLVDYLQRDTVLSLYEPVRRDEVLVAAVIDQLRLVTTKKGSRMAILRLEDDTAGLEAVVFPKVYEECGLFLQEKAIVLVKGKYEFKDRAPKILVDKVIPMARVLTDLKQVIIAIEKGKVDLKKLRELLGSSKGTIPVFFTLKDHRLTGVKIKTADDFFIAPDPALFDQISHLVGKNNLKLVV